jgi:hypothetical protein
MAAHSSCNTGRVVTAATQGMKADPKLRHETLGEIMKWAKWHRLAQKQRHLLVTHTACNLHRYAVRNQWIKGKKPYLIRPIQVSSLGQQHASDTVLAEQRERGRQQNIMPVAADKCMA